MTATAGLRRRSPLGHDAADVPAGPASLDREGGVDESRLVSKRVLLSRARRAVGARAARQRQRLARYRTPGAALPAARESLGTELAARTASIRWTAWAGSTGWSSAPGMAPSTLGTSARVTSACPPARSRIDQALARRGSPARDRASCRWDRYRQLHRRGPWRAQAGRLVRVHPSARVSPDRGRPVRHRRGLIRNRQGRPTPNAGGPVVDERSRGASCRSCRTDRIRADSG